MAWVMLPVPPLVTMPAGVAVGDRVGVNRSRVIAMISPSKRVALGQMSRWSALTWAYRPNTSFMKS
jgi:hypothetical protein